MALNNKEKFIKTAFQQFQPVVTEGLTQLFQREFSFSLGEFFEGAATEKTKDLQFPCVVFSLKGNVAHQIVIPLNLALNLYGWMLGMDPPEQAGDELLEGLQEGANQIIGQLQAATDGTEWSFQVEDVAVKNASGDGDLADLIPAGSGVTVSYALEVEGQSHQVYHFSQGVTFASEPVAAAPTANQPADPTREPDIDEEEQQQQPDDGESPWEPPVDIHRAEFDTINSKNGSNGKPRNISMLLDVELEVYVELGRKRIKIQDLLKLGKGSLIELDRSAGEPLSIFIGDKKLAEGEVVVVDDRFGIRITQLIGPKERIKSLV